MSISTNNPVSSLTIFGGLASELAPPDLPAGPSPLAVDVDFDLVGSVRTRDGLGSIYSYSGKSVSELTSQGFSTDDVLQSSETPWDNAENITFNIPLQYASVDLNLSNPESLESKNGADVGNPLLWPWVYPQGVTGQPQYTPSGQTITAYQVSGFQIANSQTASVTFGADNVAGNTIIICYAFTDSAIRGPIVITDTAGNDWTTAQSTAIYSTSGLMEIQWISGILAGPNTITITIGGSTMLGLALQCIEYNVGGSPYVLALDTTGRSIGSTTPIAGSAASTNGTNPALFIATGLTLDDEAFASISPAGWTIRNTNNVTGVLSTFLADNLFSDSSAHAWTVATSASWEAITVVFYSATVVDYAAVTMTPYRDDPRSVYSNPLQATFFQGDVPIADPILGLTLSFDATMSRIPENGANIEIALVFQGVTVGNAKIQPVTVDTPVTYTVGSSIDLWDAILTSDEVNDSSFGVQFVVQVESELVPTPITFFISNPVITINYESSGISQQLQATNFGFAIPSGTPITGVQYTIYGTQSSPEAYLILSPLGGTFPAVAPLEQFSLPSSPGSITIGTPTTGWAQAWTSALINSSLFGCQVQVFSNIPAVVNISGITATIWFGPNPPSNFNFITSFGQQDGDDLTLALDDTGVFWQENVISNPYVLSSFFNVIQPHSFGKSVTVDDREFIALSNLLEGYDMPRIYDNISLDRLSQVGPGVSPSITFTEVTYVIKTISQPAAVSIAGDQVFYSGAPGNSNLQGSIISIFGATNSTLAASFPGIDVGVTVVLAGIQDLNGFNPNGTYPVIQAGIGVQHGDTQPFFAVQGTGVTGKDLSAQGGSTYQVTTATIKTAVPIPNLDPGSQVTISGNSLPGYNSSWFIIDELNGANLAITSTSLTSNVATYNYTITSGTGPGWQPTNAYNLGDQIVDPAGFLQQVTQAGTSGGTIPFFNATLHGTTNDPNAGAVIWTNEGASNMLVTVTGCTNGTVNGVSIFDVTNGLIVGATQNTFKVDITASNIVSAAESAFAVINGTLFTFDPGSIIGSGTGGSIVVAGGLASGQRQVVLMFLTNNGQLTQAAPPVTFSLNLGANSLIANNVLIGPPNVVARVLAFTNAGASNVPGAFFYYIPENVQVTSPLNANQKITYNATIIHDNTSTSATFTFTDAVLLNSTEIDITGANQFNIRELGSSLGVIEYSNRIFAWGEQSKVQNFINLSFDGGNIGQAFIGGGPVFGGGSGTVNQVYPAGWTVDSTYGGGGGLIVSSLFGNAYSITSDGSDNWGMITQSAYQDYLKVAIIDINTTYSVRVTANQTTTNTNGNLIVDLVDTSGRSFLGGIGSGKTYGSFSIPVSSLTANYQIFTGPLLTSIFRTKVPATLLLRLYLSGADNGTVVNIDRIEPYPTEQPVYSTQFKGSYINNFEAFDQITGALGMATENQQPIRSAFTLFDQLVGVKSHSIYSTTDNGVGEPYKWTVREISNAVGTPSVNGVTVGEGWAVIADQAGLFLWDGGQPIKISGEIQPTWDKINWAYGHTLWIANDITKKRICIGVPMVTPNPWMPAFPTNANPTSPNVILMLSYRELNSASQLASEGAIRQTFMGTLKAYQLGRKWSVWNIQSPYADFITRPDTTNQLLFCNGIGNSKIYQQLASPATFREQVYEPPSVNNFNDDGLAINSTYQTYGIPKSDEQEAKQLGLYRMLCKGLTALITGNGAIAIATSPDFSDSSRTVNSTPQNLSNPGSYGDLELPINRSGYRFFETFNTNEVGSWFRLSRLNLSLRKDPNAPTRGGNF